MSGKPVGDDLREGKPTPLLARAVAGARPEQREILERVGGPDLDEDDIAAIQQVLIDTGALAAVESRIIDAGRRGRRRARCDRPVAAMPGAS